MLFTTMLLVHFLISEGQQPALRKGVDAEAGKWKTFVLKSVADVPVPPPPAKAVSTKEGEEVRKMQQSNTAETMKQIAFWNAGPPTYPWQRVADGMMSKDQYWVRTYAYMNAAIYDATVVAWNVKYKYDRSRPFEADPAIRALVSPPESPGYPCEHAVTAGAAATVLAYLFPEKADSINALGVQAAQSRIAAGVQYPSDVKAGFDLGVAVAKKIIERAMQDGYDKLYTTEVPKGREYYTGRPLRRDLTSMRTWVLQSPSQFRSPPPPDIADDILEMKAYKADPNARWRAYRFEFGWPWGDLVDQKILEYNLNLNPPRAAYVYALISISDYDNQIAHWDSKYTYFRARPDQYDTTFHALFPTPTSPSYPAGHATMAYTRAAVMSYLFPYHSEQFLELARECTESRFEAGVHYRSDNVAGEKLGRQIGEEFVKWAKNHGPF